VRDVTHDGSHSDDLESPDAVGCQEDSQYRNSTEQAQNVAAIIAKETKHVEKCLQQHEFDWLRLAESRGTVYGHQTGVPQQSVELEKR